MASSDIILAGIIGWLFHRADTESSIAFRFAAACDGIDVVLVGTGDADHFEASARAILAPPMDPDHLQWLHERFGSTAGEALWDAAD